MAFISLNEYIDSERGNKYSGASLKRKQTMSVANIALSQKFKVPDGLYDVHFQWIKPSMRQDNDNVAFAKKFILDGLVVAKSITGDGPKVINNFRDTFVLDRKLKRVECVITLIKK